MKEESLNTAIAEAKRFLETTKKLKTKMKESKYFIHCGCKETAAVRRASMDLTRALADMRSYK